ncbi:class I adenylate-forming enzyme family protein [Candidatus Viadribacter manganicus]|uniref:3-methylmercaptopropionyl-CoA ligase n=1 Tax=Candidatus Viadribacter manganicus TaxID=1759059 RepID=A0A1B1AJ39_9PROT|nr:long-chain fatty acid--CoA ligase [Candidatus Viadribacter manganicus]ANP46540.1 acid--CoA ligase [Candidatus Viadribacter manganicus]
MGVDMVDITAKRAALTPHRIAFEDALTGRTLIYAQLEDRCARLAGVLAARGVGREDRVAILCRNRIEFFEVLFACAKLGAILVPLNWRSPASELRALLEDCNPKLVVFGAEDAETARALACPALSFDDEYEAAVANAAPLRSEQRWAGDATWFLMYTSGTTGQPKGVIQTFQMSVVNAFHVTQAFGLREADTTLNFLPLFHSAGIQLITLPTLIAGGTVVVMPGFDEARALSLMPRLDIFFGVPAVYQQLALHPDFESADLARVRSWGCGGAPLADVLVERFAKKGVLVCNGYGMTETGPTAFLAARQDALTKIGSVGKPQMLLDVRIVDSEGVDVAEGESGEIWMRGAGLTPGYWNKPGETAKAFTADGWLKSGDIGRRDTDGCYYVAGRIKEMYISGGENVYPAEVENVLARHPAVLESAIIGVPDEKWGEVGHAFIMLRADAGQVTAAEVIQFCRANVAGYKTPRHVTFVDEFPRTAAGKIRKHLLAPERNGPAR